MMLSQFSVESSDFSAGPRRFLFRQTVGRFQSEEVHLSLQIEEASIISLRVMLQCFSF